MTPISTSTTGTSFCPPKTAIKIRHISVCSPVFADMLAMPSPPATEKYDGVPLLEMAGDDADVLRDFIALLYEPQCISTILDSRDFPSKILGPTQLAKKYQVDWVRKMVASRLQSVWPSTMAGGLTIEEDEHNDMIRDLVGVDAWTPSWSDNVLQLCQFPEPVSSILLARECDATAILPFAFLHLLRCHLESDEDDFPSPLRVADRTLLSSDDCHRLLLARERIGKWFYDRSGGRWTDCGNVSCEVTVLRTRLKIATDIGRDGNVLRRFQTDSEKICSSCRKALEKEVDALMDDFVDHLSTFFQLDE
ncbi:hypothetical protein B0H19DRAFT_53602 [Mycena capillaripes]|nr:hypothetical protein B0H19DRAFT_53602 [Mycena capillaripes]